MMNSKVRRVLLESATFIGGRMGLLDIYSSLRRAVAGPQVAILVYHRVSPKTYPWYLDALSPEDFEREIAYLHKVAEIMSLDLLVDRLVRGEFLSPRNVAITFDDGYKDNYRFAYPILQKYNVPVTIFLTTGFIGGSSMIWADKVCYAIWNTSMKEFEIDGLGRYSLRSDAEKIFSMREVVCFLNKVTEEQKNSLIGVLLKTLGVDIPASLGGELALSWDEIREMSRDRISFGAHTVSHPILTRLPFEEAKSEITRSKRDIEQNLDHSVTSFAYPNGEFGDFNAEIIEFLKESGFTFAVTGIPRFLTSSSDLYSLDRIPPGWSYYTFKASLSGIYPDVLTLLSWLRRSGTQRGDELRLRSN